MENGFGGKKMAWGDYFRPSKLGQLSKVHLLWCWFYMGIIVIFNLIKITLWCHSFYFHQSCSKYCLGPTPFLIFSRKFSFVDVETEKEMIFARPVNLFKENYISQATKEMLKDPQFDSITGGPPTVILRRGFSPPIWTLFSSLSFNGSHEFIIPQLGYGGWGQTYEWLRNISLVEILTTQK